MVLLFEFRVMILPYEILYSFLHCDFVCIVCIQHTSVISTFLITVFEIMPIYGGDVPIPDVSIQDFLLTRNLNKGTEIALVRHIAIYLMYINDCH